MEDIQTSSIPSQKNIPPLQTQHMVAYLSEEVKIDRRGRLGSSTRGALVITNHLYFTYRPPAYRTLCGIVLPSIKMNIQKRVSVLAAVFL